MSLKTLLVLALLATFIAIAVAEVLRDEDSDYQGSKKYGKRKHYDSGYGKYHSYNGSMGCGKCFEKCWGCLAKCIVKCIDCCAKCCRGCESSCYKCCASEGCENCCAKLCNKCPCCGYGYSSYGEDYYDEY